MQDLKKNQLVTIVILAAAAGLFLWLFASNGPSGIRSAKAPVRADIPEGKSITDSPAKPVPPLPDFPWETNVKFSDTGSVYSKGDRLEIVRSYTSTKTLSENFKLFKDYFVAKNWTISAEKTSPTSSSFTASLGSTGNRINMLFTTDNPNKNVVVVVKEEKPMYNNLEVRSANQQN